MEILIIIIVIVVVSVLSAASKKKPRQDSDEGPTRPTLSDIQRAFMMSSEMDAPQRRKPDTQQSPTRSMAPTVQKAYTPPARPVMSSRLEESVSAFQASSKYANIDLSAFHTDSIDSDEMPKKTVKHQKNALKLFENKNDYVRAVIYSEILTRKSR